ncbi:MAG: hypothetical protein LUH15_20380 [Tannerellaceae bacterium]|nr:hypothetical protein [Tannerellaceae bacterium]
MEFVTGGDTYSISNIRETDMLLSFTFVSQLSIPSHICVYEKKEKKLYISIDRGYSNPKDQLPDFHPQWFSHKNEAVGFISAEMFLEYVNSTSSIKRDDALQKKIDNFKEDDNPIIIIGKMKK